MGGSQAARTMLDVNLAALKRQGKAVDDAEMAAMAAELRARYDRETDIRYAAARAGSMRLSTRPRRGTC